MAKNKMDWMIWGKKLLLTALTVVLAGGISVWQNNPYWLAIIPILQALQNYLKHK